MNKLFCTNCSEPLDDDAKFCEGCGTKVEQPVSPVSTQPPPVQYQPQPPPYQQPQHMQYQPSQYDTPQVRALIGNNADYYIRKFTEMERTKSNASWNWPAFLFNWIWMLYRGMSNNPMTWIMLAINVLATILIYVGIGLVISLGAAIVSGILGNAWYKKLIDQKLAQIKI